MPSLETFKLHFHSGLHRGSRGVGQEAVAVDVPADTLFAALTATWRLLGEDMARWQAGFVDDPPLLLTSAFPFVGGVRFFPLPARLDLCFGDAVLQARGKELKRIRYVSEGVLRRVLAGKRVDDDLFPEDPYAEPRRGVALQEGALWLLRDELAGLPPAFQRPRDRLFALRRARVWSEARVSRVTVDRSASASTYYQTGRISFAAGCGLWFGWQERGGENGAWAGTPADDARRALNVLQDYGLGGERSAGYGAFRLEAAGRLSLPDADVGGLAYLLSRYHPTEGELAGGALQARGTAYQLVAVGGFLQSPDSGARLRRRLHLIEAGSLVRLPGLPAGDLTDVRPVAGPEPFPHPVWRYGYALGAGVHDGVGGDS